MNARFIAILVALVAVPLLAWRIGPALPGLWTELISYESPKPIKYPDIERFDADDPAYLDTELRQESLAQYRFAAEYSKQHGFKSVADIASGTCYGMKMLQKVVPVVHGYDKLDLCGNFVIDLDMTDWGRPYDAIVSFETLEHLQRPEFFLQNAVRSAPVLIISTVINEVPGLNPHHLSGWTLEELDELLSRYYTCETLHRVGDRYEPGHEGPTDFFAVCKRA